MRNKKNTFLIVAAVVAVSCLALLAASKTAGISMFGNTTDRNMISIEKGVPTKFDPDSGLNVKWSMPLGSQSYAGPIVHDGKVFVGTNNELEINPKYKGDRGNIMAFDAETGEFLWQSAHAKLGAGRVNDWPLQGVCSTPALEGDRLYYVSNRAEVICADAEGFRDGENDGPFKDEPGKSEIDEDVIWKLDMIGELDVFPHNLAAGSPLLVGDLIFTVTGNGVDEGHVNIPSPASPSFIAVNKKTGELVWENAAPANSILHGSWSNPSYGVVGDTPQVLFPGGDGWLYSFEPKSGKLIWKFDMNPKGSTWELGGRGTRNNVISTAVVHDGLIYIGVGQDPEHGEGHGNFWALDVAGKTGDVSESAVAWHVGGEEFGRTMSTVAIYDGLLYVADLAGFVYCFDPKSGKLHWKYDTFAAIWGSPFYVDGKIYIGDEDGDVAVLKAGKGKDGKTELLHEVNMGAAVYTTPVVKDGVMYIVSRNKLFALEDGIEPKKAEPEKAAKAKG
jgi:outer membrane protein assembly factor BamB